MYNFHVVTIFPELFSSFLETSLIGKAIQNRRLSVELTNLRDYTKDRHHSVDDTPYGGGAGMVMKAEPIFDMLASAPPAHRVFLSPRGKAFTQQKAQELSEKQSVLLFCGRYEGVDERVRSAFDEDISLGDFVLNGGEVAAMAIIEAVSRLLTGVLGNQDSIVEESFNANLLEYPQYTRPQVFQGDSVPDVLLSGDHAKVADWRRLQSLLLTRKHRPDLFETCQLTEKDRQMLTQVDAAEENLKK